MARQEPVISSKYKNKFVDKNQTEVLIKSLKSCRVLRYDNNIFNFINLLLLLILVFDSIESRLSTVNTTEVNVINGSVRTVVQNQPILTNH